MLGDDWEVLEGGNRKGDEVCCDEEEGERRGISRIIVLLALPLML